MLPPKYFCLALALTASGLSPASAEPPSFSQDVRPLLSDRCLKCHGPDDKGRKGKLRLDLRDSALTGGKSGAAAIVPGNISDSEILKRMRSTDPDEVMPTPKSNRKLTEAHGCGFAAPPRGLFGWVDVGTDTDRLAWLALGRDPAGSDRAQMAVLQAAVLSLTSSGGKPMQRQIAEDVGLDELGFASGENGTLGVVALGKKLTDQLSIRLEQTLGGTAGSLLRMDFMLSDRWRLRGTAGAENAGDILFTLRFD